MKIAVETEKVDDRMATEGSDVTLDEILGSPESTTDDLTAEIDAILGGN